ncbi:PEP-CTERM sorting domain-containing protein [Tautonia marina]|uniref:PEP-CTERM sorting domain-containing protein n=1 Tax=Tautonia marina TaxID=2653855 RepID=UPI001260DA98|nr:PEP-CTERM sorting domain-containing protein [Tautonia marina]
MDSKRFGTLLGVVMVLGLACSAESAEILYVQDFENPTNFRNDGADVNIFRQVNQLYGDQPPGFQFAQRNTVETLLITGNQAFGTGYSDPSGIGGNYTLGMLSSYENDLLGLSFDTGGRQYLNFQLTVSSIDLSAWGGPFVSPGAVPVFRFTLYDNPSGANGLFGNGTILDQIEASGTASARSVFDWTTILLPLNASQSTNGKVTIQIDLLDGGYAAMDNFRIVASDIRGDLGTIPEPSSVIILGLGLTGLAGVMARKRVKRSRADDLVAV